MRHGELGDSTSMLRKGRRSTSHEQESAGLRIEGSADTHSIEYRRTFPWAVFEKDIIILHPDSCEVRKRCHFLIFNASFRASKSCQPARDLPLGSRYRRLQYLDLQSFFPLDR